MTPPVQISTQRRIAAYGFNGKVGSEQRLQKIRLQPDRENAFARTSGGGNGPDFKPSLPFSIKNAGLPVTSRVLLKLHLQEADFEADE